MTPIRIILGLGIGLALAGACACEQPSDPVPLVCEVEVEDCECASVGCPCSTVGTCNEGTCNEASGICVLVDDGMVFVPAGSFWMGCCEQRQEWTSDGYEVGVGYGALPAENPTGIETESGRVFRGGGYQSLELAQGGYILRTSRRGHGRISWTALTLDYGVRCAQQR
ncbi:formylglycine-generating enzyme family protein [Enhygromyxa salina]|uniref:formylglycine-generating enzyme family protein n=1 Tax=Enhygromyxa salina TaxID=215803 RepID=UPI0011BAAC3C|nr:formylglycine-generating enzyme family protein [Enhygromyxa salina]